MIPLAIFAFLVGAVLGMRWRVLVLLPTCSLFAIGAVVVEMFAAGPKTIVLDVVMVMAAHQAGYLFGALVRGYLAYGARQRVAIDAKSPGLSARG